jgi:hypothetical protein
MTTSRNAVGYDELNAYGGRAANLRAVRSTYFLPPVWTRFRARRRACRRVSNLIQICFCGGPNVGRRPQEL